MVEKNSLEDIAGTKLGITEAVFLALLGSALFPPIVPYAAVALGTYLFLGKEKFPEKPAHDGPKTAPSHTPRFGPENDDELMPKLNMPPSRGQSDIAEYWRRAVHDALLYRLDSYRDNLAARLACYGVGQQEIQMFVSSAIPAKSLKSLETFL